jgi:hypothetical protein
MLWARRQLHMLFQLQQKAQHTLCDSPPLHHKATTQMALKLRHKVIPLLLVLMKKLKNS